MESISCYICTSSIGLHNQNVYKTKSKHSKTSIWDLIVKLTKENTALKEYITDVDAESLETCVCCAKCLDQVDEYDLACMTAQRIEHQLQDVLVNTKLRSIDDPSNTHFVEVHIDESKDNFTFADEDFCYDNHEASSDANSEPDADDVEQEVKKEKQDEAKKPPAVSTSKSKPNVDKSKCDLCLWHFNDDTEMINHNEFHSKASNPFQCAICDRICHTKRGLMQHVKTMHRPDNGYVRCGICAFTVKAKSDVKNHVALHEKNARTPLRCLFCKTNYPVRNTLIKHIQRQHDGRQTGKCYVCGFIWSDQKVLGEHIKLHENDKFKHKQCVICEESFETVHDRNMHIRTHNEKPVLQCEHCGRQFGWISDLNKHRSIHDTDKQYQCDICSKKFRLLLFLRKHILSVHAKTKPFCCEKCGKTFARKDNLACHERTHAGLPWDKWTKRQTCQFCPKTFSRTKAMIAHIEKDHGVLQQPHTQIVNSLMMDII